MKRSANGLNGLIAVNGRVRLCKGAFRESSDDIVGPREEIDENYLKLMEVLFERGIILLWQLTMTK